MRLPRLHRLLPWLVLVAVATGALWVAARHGEGAPAVDARVEALTARLRCPTCQGLAVADSPSSTARAITDDVRRRVEAGERDGAILSAYVDRYGEWILLAPRSSGVGVVVWVLPVAALVLAAGGLGLTFWRWRREPRLRPSEADRALVAGALAARRREQQ